MSKKTKKEPFEENKHSPAKSPDYDDISIAKYEDYAFEVIYDRIPDDIQTLYELYVDLLSKEKPDPQKLPFETFSDLVNEYKRIIEKIRPKGKIYFGKLYETDEPLYQDLSKLLDKTQLDDIYYSNSNYIDYLKRFQDSASEGKKLSKEEYNSLFKKYTELVATAQKKGFTPGTSQIIEDIIKRCLLEKSQ